MATELSFIILVIALAFAFDFINGFHDAANSIATIVATGVLRPFTAVIWAAFFNFIAFLFFKVKVANTIGTGLVDPHLVDPYFIFSALIGAIVWNLVTWFYGLPSSSSHALIGGLVGAGLAKGGTAALKFTGLNKVLIAIVLSPLLGFFLGLILMAVANYITQYWTKDATQHWFSKIQFISAALLSLGHGGNDAQKTMGIIAVLLFSAHLLNGAFYVPLWVIISCNLVIALGTLIGGWRIVHTLGHKITKLTPMRGCCAETGAALTLFLATDLGIPVSTTHTITGAITGVGLRNVQWSVVRRIIWAWIFTIPASGIIAAALIFIWAKLH